jgi:glycosyltransferase involved in cell wall biosynthesis
VSDDPRVSILLPVRDAAATLPACLASIARQSEARFECVIVDDGSRDASPRIAEHRVARDPRFRLIRGSRAGVAAASNRGLAECRAPFVARMDADDWMHRERLACQLAAFDAEPDLAAVATRVRYFPRSRLGPGLRRYEAWLNQQGDPRRVREDAFVECPVANPTLMLRRERFRTLGYRECDWPEDYDLVLRLLAEGARIRVLPRRLHGWRLHPARLTSRSPLYAVPRFTACKAHFLAEGLLRGHADYLLWGYGRTGRSLARALRGHGRQPAAIVELHPGRLGQRIHGAPVIPPEALGAPAGRPLLASVAGAEARGILRRELARRGWRECVDFAVVA